jgi:2,5-diketo-D-gluconate reductase A
MSLFTMFSVIVMTTSFSSRYARLANGVSMPFVNLGGVSSSPSNYSAFLELGGRGLDTALTYGDAIQRDIAAAITQSTVPREDIFLTTKVPCCPEAWGGDCAKPEFSKGVAANIALDVKILGSIDLLLLHWPCAGVDAVEDTLAAWRGLEAALNAGVTRAIGVSNFNASFLETLLPRMKTKPAVNQCGHSIGNTQNTLNGGDDRTVEWCQANGISYSAYSPLGGLSGIDILKNLDVLAIAHAHTVSAAQVALRWLVQQNISVVTAASNPAYIREDIDVFSFVLTPAEMATLARIR